MAHIWSVLSLPQTRWVWGEAPHTPGTIHTTTKQQWKEQVPKKLTVETRNRNEQGDVKENKNNHTGWVSHGGDSGTADGLSTSSGWSNVGVSYTQTIHCLLEPTDFGFWDSDFLSTSLAVQISATSWSQEMQEEVFYASARDEAINCLSTWTC